LARDYLSKGLLARAAAEIRRLATERIDPIEAALLTGEILMRQGFHGEALERFDSALIRLEGQASEPRVARAWLERARALLRLRRPDEAHEAARQAAFHEEAGIETLRIHGEAFLLEGDAAAAVAAFRELTHLLPGSSADFRDLGV